VKTKKNTCKKIYNISFQNKDGTLILEIVGTPDFEKISPKDGKHIDPDIF
jgi:hypothetical protein